MTVGDDPGTAGSKVMWIRFATDNEILVEPGWGRDEIRDHVRYELAGRAVTEAQAQGPAPEPIMPLTLASPYVDPLLREDPAEPIFGQIPVVHYPTAGIGQEIADDALEAGLIPGEVFGTVSDHRAMVVTEPQPGELHPYVRTRVEVLATALPDGQQPMRDLVTRLIPFGIRAEAVYNGSDGSWRLLIRTGEETPVIGTLGQWLLVEPTLTGCRARLVEEPEMKIGFEPVRP